jgi:hypothetical protein
MAAEVGGGYERTRPGATERERRSSGAQSILGFTLASLSGVKLVRLKAADARVALACPDEGTRAYVPMGSGTMGSPRGQKAAIKTSN